jgi:hypothetical protein
MLPGLPAENDTFYCYGTSCYSYTSTAGTYTVASASCRQQGGYLAAWNSYQEQVGGSSSAWPACPAPPLCQRSHPVGVARVRYLLIIFDLLP